MSRKIAIAATGPLSATTPAMAAPAALLLVSSPVREAPEVTLPGVLEDEEWTRHNGWTRD